MPRQTVTCTGCGAEIQIQVMVVDPRGAARARWEKAKGAVTETEGPIVGEKGRTVAAKRVPCGVRHRAYEAGCAYCRVASGEGGDGE